VEHRPETFVGIPSGRTPAQQDRVKLPLLHLGHEGLELPRTDLNGDPNLGQLRLEVLGYLTVHQVAADRRPQLQLETLGVVGLLQQLASFDILGLGSRLLATTGNDGASLEWMLRRGYGTIGNADTYAAYLVLPALLAVRRLSTARTNKDRMVWGASLALMLATLAVAQTMGLGDRFAILAYDARGHGASGGLITIDGPKEIADVRAVFDWLRDRPDVSDTKIGGWGISYGGGALWNSLVAGVPWAAIEPTMTWTDLRSALLPQGLVKSGVVAGFLGSLAPERVDPEVLAIRDAAFAGSLTTVASKPAGISVSVASRPIAGSSSAIRTRRLGGAADDGVMPRSMAIGTKNFEAACSLILCNPSPHGNAWRPHARAPAAYPVVRFRTQRMNTEARRPANARKSSRIRDIVHRALPAMRTGDETDGVVVVAMVAMVAI